MLDVAIQIKCLKMSSPSPKSSLLKLGLVHSKPKPLRIMVLGQSGVGKTGMFNLKSRFLYF